MAIARATRRIHPERVHRLAGLAIPAGGTYQRVLESTRLNRVVQVPAAMLSATRQRERRVRNRSADGCGGASQPRESVLCRMIQG